jgi:hypothetical protein
MDDGRGCVPPESRMTAPASSARAGAKRAAVAAGACEGVVPVMVVVLRRRRAQLMGGDGEQHRDGAGRPHLLRG